MMSKRYKEYWISQMEKPKYCFVSEDEIKEYVKLFPKGTKVLMEKYDLSCEGHTFRQIMGYDPLDCDCEPG